MSLRARSARAYVLVAIVASLLGGLTISAGPLSVFDSIRYDLVADSVRTGGGVRSPLLWLHADPLPPLDEAGRAAFVLQPPGYPLLLAGGQAAFGRRAGARSLNLLAHLASALMACALATRCAGPAAGALAGVCLAACAPLLRLTRYSMGETVFLTCLLGCLLVLGRARTRGSLGLALLGGVALAGTISVRYAGLVLLGVVAYDVVREARAGARPGLAVRATALVLPGVVTFAALVTRGSPFAFDKPRSLLAALGDLLGLCAQTLAASHPLAWALALLALPAARVLRDWRVRASLWNRGLDHMLLVALGMAALLVRGFTRTLEAEWRYVLPILALGGVAGAVVVIAERRAARAPSLRSALVCVISLGVFAAQGAGPAARRPSPPALLPQLEPYAWLARRLSPGEPVLTNAPHLVAQARDAPAYGLPQAYNSYPIPPDVEAWLPGALAHCRASYVLILTRPGELEASPGWRPDVAGLYAGESRSPALTRVHKSPEGVVYQLTN